MIWGKKNCYFIVSLFNHYCQYFVVQVMSTNGHFTFLVNKKKKKKKENSSWWLWLTYSDHSSQLFVSEVWTEQKGNKDKHSLKLSHQISLSWWRFVPLRCNHRTGCVTACRWQTCCMWRWYKLSVTFALSGYCSAEQCRRTCPLLGRFM